ncbi:43867_t:CDS:2, partial [Gigaspora margarita]
IKGWRELFIKKNLTEIEQWKTKEIALRIKKCYEMIENQQGRIIKSFLNKPFRKVIIDKYISKNGLHNEIILDPEEIKLKSMSQKRNKGDLVQGGRYRNLGEGIARSYIKTQKIFRTFASACIKEGTVLLAWKVSQIYTIPKDSDWNYDLNNVRSIALIESFRKCLTKILTKYLSKIMVDKRILKGLNFAELHRSFMEEPIQVLNSILEDTKEKEKELWILFQNMCKAFDFVLLEILELALWQICILLKIILNGPKKREPNTIKLCDSLVQEEKRNSITRFLGIWISNNCRETLIKARARGIPEIKIRSGGKTRGKKPKWFSLLEEKIIENAEERTIKPEWISGQANQFGSSISLLEISNDKRKKETVSKIAKLETRIEKCSGYEYNRSIVEGNCTTRIRFDVARKTYNKDPPENKQEFKNLRSLESPEKELILQAELKEELKEKILAILTRNLNHQKRKYCYYTDGSLQKNNKDK